MDETKVQIGEEVLLDIGIHSEWYISSTGYDGESVDITLRKKADRIQKWWLSEEYSPDGKLCGLTLQSSDGNAVDLVSEQKWIPCSERLPKKEEATYLICTETGHMCSCRWTNDMYGLGSNEWSKWGWHIMDKPQYAKVVAWMPLKPWKGEDDGEDIQSEAEQ